MLYYRYVVNRLTAITRDLPGNVLLTTTENLGNSSSAGAEIILNADVAKWATLSLNGNLFYDQIDASRLGYGKNKGRVAWHALLNADFIPFHNATLQLNARYTSPMLLPQGRREGFFTADMGMRYEIPHLNLSFTATFFDVFNTFKSVDSIKTSRMQQRLERRSNTRVFSIGVVWKLNKKADDHEEE